MLSSATVATQAFLLKSGSYHTDAQNTRRNMHWRHHHARWTTTHSGANTLLHPASACVSDRYITYPDHGKYDYYTSLHSLKSVHTSLEQSWNLWCMVLICLRSHHYQYLKVSHCHRAHVQLQETCGCVRMFHLQSG